MLQKTDTFNLPHFRIYLAPRLISDTLSFSKLRAYTYNIQILSLDLRLSKAKTELINHGYQIEKEYKPYDNMDTRSTITAYYNPDPCTYLYV